jgi:hypothetical protein
MSYIKSKTNAFQIETGDNGENLTPDLKKYSNVNEVTPDVQQVIRKYFEITPIVRTATFYPAVSDFTVTFNKRLCSFNELNNTSTINVNLQNQEAVSNISDGINLYGNYVILCPHSTKSSVNFTMNMTTIGSYLTFLTYNTSYWGYTTTPFAPGKYGGYTVNADNSSPITTGLTFNLTRSISTIQFMIIKITNGYQNNSPVLLNPTTKRYTGDIFCSYNVWYAAKYEYNLLTQEFTKLSTGLDYSQIMPVNYKYFVYDQPVFNLPSSEFIANTRGNLPSLSGQIRHDDTPSSLILRNIIEKSTYSYIAPDMTLANDIEISSGTNPIPNSNYQRTYWRIY